MCLAQGPQRSDAGEAGTRGPVTCDFQQCGILTSVDSVEPVQSPFKFRNFK